MKRTLSVILALVLLFAALPLAAGAAESDLAPTGDGYNLWLGTTQVTDANKGDILGDGGKAQFDPSTHTLTLSDPTISGEHNYSKIFCNGFDLTVKGNYTMTSAQSDNALTVFDHDLTLDGNFTFFAWCYAVEASYDINVVSGRVIAKLEDGGSEQCQAFCSDAGSITFGDNVEYFEAAVTSTWNTVYAVAYSTEGTVTLSSKLKLTAPEGGSFREGSCYYYEGGKQKRAKTVIIEPADPSDVKYEVWVGATQVTAVNKNDILGDGGNAKYDPSTATLTLNDPTILSNYSAYGKTFRIYAKNDLTVEGSYNMTSYDADYGIDCDKNLTTDGDFIFRGSIHGISAGYTLTINGSLVGRSNSTTYTSSAGIKASQIKFGEISRVEAEGKKVYAIYAERGLTLPPELYVSTPQKTYIEKGTVVDNSTSSPTIAKHVVINCDDKRVVACGSEIEIFGKIWDSGNPENRMKRSNNGTYYISYNVTKAYKDVQVKVFVDDFLSEPEWFGDENGNVFTFDLTGAGTFGIDFDPKSKKVSISGIIVDIKTNMEVNKVYAVGNGDKAWLNGIVWDPGNEKNEMDKVEEGVYEIEYRNVTVSWDNQVKFAVNGTWTYNFGGTYSGNGVETDADFNGENIWIDFDDCPWDEDTCAIKLRLDLRNYDHSTKTGAKFTVTIVYGESLPDDGFTVSGSFTSYLDTAGVTVELLKDGKQIDSHGYQDDNGTYRFENVAAGKYTLRVSKKNHVTRDYEITLSGNIAQDVKICPLGDVNGDGKVTNFDYSKVNQHVCKIEGKELTDYAFKCADVNEDGKVTNFDAGKINQHVCKVKSLWS